MPNTRSQRATKSNEVTTQSSDMAEVTLATLNETIQSLVTQVKTLSDKVDKVSGLEQSFNMVQANLQSVVDSLEFTQDHMETLISSSMPKFMKHMAKIATESAIKQVESECWQRKWGLIIRGIPGDAGEAPQLTRAKALRFAEHKLGIQTPPVYIAGCHRLSYKNKDSGIIIRFTDMWMKEKWLDAAGLLKPGHPNAPKPVPGVGPSVGAGPFSISTDIPPVIRTVREDLLKMRKEMLKKKEAAKVHIKDIYHWPFLRLVADGRSVDHDWSKERVAANFLGVASMESDEVMTSLLEVATAISDAERIDLDDAHTLEERQIDARLAARAAAAAPNP